VRRLIPVFAASLMLAACSSQYHPEYHPVVVSNFSQNLSYPVSVNNGGAPTERSPVYVVPGVPGATAPAVQTVAVGPGPIIAAPAPPPPGFFDHE
jgi:hypothetical protein